jgi:hypothetical protein
MTCRFGLREKQQPMKQRFSLRPLAFIPVFLAVIVVMFSCGGGATLQPPPASGWTLAWIFTFAVIELYLK